MGVGPHVTGQRPPLRFPLGVLLAQHPVEVSVERAVLGRELHGQMQVVRRQHAAAAEVQVGAEGLVAPLVAGSRHRRRQAGRLQRHLPQHRQAGDG
ncbi:hypothetical protein ACLQ20_24945 [Micromonospora sp. DT46]|uniref:hypothetical protein n=1 Tax=unclassified Micromonospora TaxID=2617518 RepID=UPI00124AED5A|nr:MULTISPECIES: hypothetical protein [unclassified Micromonospora]KAB1161503.1 hypothetical protein F6X68_04310 [Micromonospora sp. AMSO12t]WSF99830.1 hypothetical protein OG989_19235 [Micromonospora sp. NBC_01740]